MRTPAHTSLFVFGQFTCASPKGEGGVLTIYEGTRVSALGNTGRYTPWALFNQGRGDFQRAHATQLCLEPPRTRH